MKFEALINGELISRSETIKIMNPTTWKVAGEVPALKKEDIEKAYESAEAAFHGWKNTPLLERIAMLEKFASLIEKHVEPLSEILMSEIAKGKKDCISEIKRTAEYIRYTNEEAKRVHLEAYDGKGLGAKGKLGVFLREPIGVILCIGPFNYPINLLMSKVAPALVMGNTVVAKGATQGSLIASAISQYFVEAGFPKGVINIITGRGRDIGDYLVSNKHVKMVSFTGGKEVGRKISKDATMVPVVLELGGKDAAIVCEDANIQLAAKEIIKGAFGYSGQRCTAIKRVLVHKSVAGHLEKELLNEIAKLTVGNPQDNCDITPVIDMPTAENAEKLIKDAVHKGAKIIFGGTRKENLVQPTLIKDVTEAMEISWEEPFAPVLPIMEFDNYDEVVRIHNKSEFGLQGSIFTKDTERFLKLAHKLDTGTVNLNRSSARSPDSFPFIGVKNSGLGVQGIRESLLSVTRIKGIVFNY